MQGFSCCIWRHLTECHLCFGEAAAKGSYVRRPHRQHHPWQLYKRLASPGHLRHLCWKLFVLKIAKFRLGTMGMWWDNYGGTFQPCFKARQQKAEVWRPTNKAKWLMQNIPLSLSLSLYLSPSRTIHIWLKLAARKNYRWKNQALKQEVHSDPKCWQRSRVKIGSSVLPKNAIPLTAQPRVGIASSPAFKPCYLSRGSQQPTPSLYYHFDH